MLNGVSPEFYWPTDANMKFVCEPLAPWASKLTFVRGIDVEGSENHFAIRSMFTGAPIADYSSPDPGVQSLDQVIADHIGSSTRPTALDSLHLGALPASAIEFYQKYGRSTFFFNRAPVHYDANPVTAFDKHFGDLGAPGPMTDAEALRRDVALGLAAAELEVLQQRVAGSPSEASKLAVHGEALAALRAGDLTPVPAGCDATPLTSVEALRAQLQGNEPGAYDNALYNPIFDAQVDIMARALICGLTRVATLQANEADGNVIVPVLGGLPHHLTSHDNPAGFAECQRWYASKLARLLQQLDVDDPLDPGRTVLDNSCVVWMAECNPDHGATDICCVYAGSAGGRLVSGGLIDVPGATNREFLRTIASVFGVADTTAPQFGGSKIQEIVA